jgi:hypothetical protein
MDRKIPQVMHCIICYNSPIDASSLIRIQARKGIISYYKTNGTMALKKHVDVHHVVIAKKIEEINNHVTRILEKQLAKKDIMCPIMKYPNS